MAGLRTYLDFAENDLKYAEAVIKDEQLALSLSNAILASLSQAVEKYLKHVLDISCDGADKSDNDLMHSHKLPRLLKRVSEICTIDMSPMEARWLGDFYFTSRYPGDYEFTASTDDIKDALDITHRVRSSVLAYKCNRDCMKEDVVKASEVSPIERLRMQAESEG